MSTIKKINAFFRGVKEELRTAKRAAQDMLGDQILKARFDAEKLWKEKRRAAKERRMRYGSSMYAPHQGEREKARRRLQLARGIISFEHRSGYNL